MLESLESFQASATSIHPHRRRVLLELEVGGFLARGVGYENMRIPRGAFTGIDYRQSRCQVGVHNPQMFLFFAIFFKCPKKIVEG